MRRMKLLILAISLTLGLAGTCIFPVRLSCPQPKTVSMTAWWGGLYPEYCLPGAMELKGEEDAQYGEEQEISVKIRFKYLTFLNDVGGNHE